MVPEKQKSKVEGQFRHFVLHKPHGYLSQLINNQQVRKNKKLLGELYDFPSGTMSIGRLDEKSEGLLLLTTNGKVSKLINSNKFEKEYYVQVDGLIDQPAVDLLKVGVEITVKKEPYTTTPCKARILEETPSFLGESKYVRDERHGPTSWLSVTLTEGKFRQVRKMTAAVGFPTLRLVRVRIASTRLNGLEAGEVKEVEQFKL
jgi:23S rRNA pseudouridine2457 synthase